ncbi:unnamed protein product [Durusdinium trenchii]|uniref:Uncharacterized protein n=2 Tax=Durusdinium trenchii TaxID=1381693 RepID=A0ABP0L358_9DINO
MLTPQRAQLQWPCARACAGPVHRHRLYNASRRSSQKPTVGTRALLGLSACLLRLTARLTLRPAELSLELQGNSFWNLLLGRFSSLSCTLHRTKRFMRARDLRVTWEEVDLGLNPVLYFALPLVMLWKPLPSFYLLLLFYLLRPAWQRSNPRRSSTQGSRDSRGGLSFEASAGAEELWECRLWRSWLNVGLGDIMNYSIAGLVAELGDLRQATTFELQGLQVTDALELDAVAQLPDNALFKYRLKTGLFVGDLDGSQCLLWDDPAIQVKPMLLPDFWAPIGGFAGRRLPARLRLRRLEVQDGLLFVSGHVGGSQSTAIVRR